MPVIVVGEERNFQALRPRLLAGRVPAARARAIAQAVRDANPGVDLRALRPGTVLRIPDLPELSLREGLSLDEPSRRRLVELLGTSASGLAHVVEAAGRRAEAHVTEAHELAKILDGREVGEAARKDPELAAQLERLRATVADEPERARARVSALQAAHARWAEELEALETLL